MFRFGGVKSFDTIMGTFSKAKEDLGMYVTEMEKQRDEAGAEAERLVQVANDCCDCVTKANKAKDAMTKLLGE